MTRPRLLAVALLTAFILALILFAASLDANGRAGCQTLKCEVRVKLRLQNEGRRAAVAPYAAWLRALRWCESTNNHRAVDPSGTYTGWYQFDDQTWRSVGGTGRAMHAVPLEQSYRAVRLRKARGTAPWPVCG